MAFFKLPHVNTNTDSWGPSSSDTDANDDASSRFAHLPYAPFGRSDRLGRCADFTTQSFARTGDATAGYFRNARSRHNQESNKNLEFQYKVDAEVSMFWLLQLFHIIYFHPKNAHILCTIPVCNLIYIIITGGKGISIG